MSECVWAYCLFSVRSVLPCCFSSSVLASIVTKILSSTVGLLVNKARDSAAAKLKDGDVSHFTDAKIRELAS